MLTEWHDGLDSTQDEAKRQFEAGAITRPKVIVAREQWSGRGTKGRTWQSEKDAGVYMTLVLPATPQQNWQVTPLYTQATALACVETLRTLYELPVAIKPINDLVVDGRKLGGILLESMSSGDAERGFSVLFIGIGLNWEPVSLPEVSAYQATSLSELLLPSQLQSVSRQRLVTELTQSIQAQCEALQDNDNGERRLNEALSSLWV
jgi:BirA family transcriptional regulator, biotin operon repressor / biotin---[acetyl-CoA-carboxylase] ligase